MKNNIEPEIRPYITYRFSNNILYRENRVCRKVDILTITENDSMVSLFSEIQKYFIINNIERIAIYSFEEEDGTPFRIDEIVFSHNFIFNKQEEEGHLKVVRKFLDGIKEVSSGQTSIFLNKKKQLILCP